MRSKAAEDMLHALPSKKDDLFVVTEHKTFRNSVVPGGGSAVDKIHVFKSSPEKEHVDAFIKLVAGPSAIHDSEGKLYFVKSMSFSCNWFKAARNQDCNSLYHCMLDLSEMIL